MFRRGMSISVSSGLNGVECKNTFLSFILLKGTNVKLNF